MPDDAPPPLSLRERIRQLEQAAASPLVHPDLASSHPLGPTSSASSPARYTEPPVPTPAPSAAPSDRPTSTTSVRTAPPRPHFGHGFRTAPVPQARDAETALSAHLATASPARSRAGSGTGAALSATAPGGAPRGAPESPEAKQRPTPSPRPITKVEVQGMSAGTASRSPPLPARSSTLVQVESSPAAVRSPGPSLPPRRASTLGVSSPTSIGAGPGASANSSSPALPPRPRATTAASPAPNPAARTVPPPPPPGAQRNTPLSLANGTSRPALPSKPTTHDPLSLAAAASLKPYAPPSSAPRSPSFSPSPSPAASRASLVPDSAARASSPAWLPRSKARTPLDIDPRAETRYVRVFALLADGAGRVDAAVAAAVWRRSGLPEGELRRIWEDVAQPGESALDRDEFARGMWMIDESLRVRRDRSLQRGGLRV